MRHGGTQLRPAPHDTAGRLEHPAAGGDHGLDRPQEPRGLVDDPQGPGTLPADRSGGGGKPRPEKGRGAHPRGARPPGPEQGRSLPHARRLGLRHPEPRQRRHGARSRPPTSFPRAWTPPGRSIFSAGSGVRWRPPTRICRPPGRTCTIRSSRFWPRSASITSICAPPRPVLP